MKNKLLKSILSMVLVATLLAGDISVVFASEPAKASVENEVLAETKVANSQYGQDTAQIEGFWAYREYNSLCINNLWGYAQSYKIYVNDKVVKEVTNPVEYEKEYVWDETLQSYIEVETDTQIKAPYFYLDYTLYLDGVEPQAGATYVVKVVPYNSEGTEGTSSSYKIAASTTSVNNVYAYLQTGYVYDENGKTTGFKTINGIQLEVYTSYVSGLVYYEIQRSTKEKTEFSTVETIRVDSDSYFYWTDTSVTAGKTYYYRVRPVVIRDDYVAKNSGAWSKTVGMEVGKPTASCGVAYTEDGVLVEAYSNDIATGFEIYRSTKKTGTYKKIATINGTSYLDKSVTSGTYYYKVKPFNYNSVTKKTLKGELSDPVGVKLVLGSFYVEAKYTSATSVKLSWDKVKGAKSYEIYIKQTSVAGDAYKYVGSTSKSSYTLKNLEKDESYSIQVRACKDANSLKSYYQSYTIGVNTGLTSPRNVEIKKRTVSVKGDKMTITSKIVWDKCYAAKSYRVEAWDNVEGKYVVLKDKLTATSYTLKNTIEKGNNSFKYSDIRIYAVKGDDEYSTYVYDTNYLNRATKVKAVKKNATSVKVSWSKVTGADSYLVYRSTELGGRVQLDTVTGTSYIDEKVTPGVEYTYFVRPMSQKFNVYGDYGYDYEVEDASDIAVYTHKMTAPTISDVKNSASKKATITWKKVAYATEYVVYRATKENGKYEKVGVTEKLTYTDTKLSKGRKYYYKIVAKTVNDAGFEVESGMSKAKSVTIKK